MRLLTISMGKWSRPTLAVGCAALAVLVGLFDQAAGGRFSLALLYLGPVTLASWFVGKSAGLGLAGLSSTLWLVNDLQHQGSAMNSVPGYWNAAQTTVLFFVASVLFAVMSRVLRREKEAARTDYLTSLPNPRAFYERLEHEIACLRRYRRPLTLAYFDIDNFKMVNDRLGHGEGDELLRAVSRSLKENIRATDFVARLGGGEFTLLLPDTGKEAAYVLARRLTARLSDEMHAGGWPATFSTGMITCLAAPSSMSDLVNLADRMMYQVKHRGKNSIRHEIYNAPSTRRLEEWDEPADRTA